MSKARACLLALVVMRAHTSIRAAFAQAAITPTPVITVVSSDSRLRASYAGLRIVVRDADAPDQPVDQAYVVVASPDSTATKRPPRGFSSSDRGLVSAAGLDSGEVLVRVRRVGYHEARVAVHLRPSCEQVLEIYIARSIVQLDRCQIRTPTSPPCDPDPPPTPGRAVLTTCANAA
jgi:hypothetical protein